MKKHVLAVCVLFACASAQAATTGYPWTGQQTVTKTVQQKFYVAVEKVGTWTGSLPSISPTAMFNANTQFTTSTTLKDTPAVESSGADWHFDVVVGTEDWSGVGNNRVELLRWHSNGQPVTKSYTTTADIQGGLVRVFTITAVKDSDGSTETVAVYEMQPGTGSYTGSVTRNYNFTIAIGMVEQTPDADDDGILDANDPYPEDPTNAGWYGGVNGDTDGDGDPNWSDPYPYDPERNTASGAGGGGSTSSYGVNDGLHVQTIMLDNSAGTTAAEFIVTITPLSVEGGHQTVTQTVRVEAGVKLPYKVEADYAFTVSATLISWVDGEKVESPVVQAVESVQNASGTATGGAASGTKGVGETTTPTTTPSAATTELEALNKVVDAVNALSAQNTKNANSTNEILDTMEGHMTSKGKTMPTTFLGGIEALKNEMAETIDTLLEMKTTLNLGLGGTGNSTLTWYFTLPLFGTYSFSLEPHAVLIDNLRSVMLWIFSIFWFVRAVKITRGAFVG